MLVFGQSGRPPDTNERTVVYTTTKRHITLTAIVEIILTHNGDEEESKKKGDDGKVFRLSEIKATVERGWNGVESVESDRDKKEAGEQQQYVKKGCDDLTEVVVKGPAFGV